MSIVVVITGIQKAQLIVDAPCSEMHTDAFIEVRQFILV